jgi:hypothetical protein
MGSRDIPARPGVHVRTFAPVDLHERIAHLAITRHTSIAELALEGLVLVCRFYDQGAGLPEPVPPAVPHAAKPTTITAAAAALPSLRDVVPLAAACGVVADVDDYFDVNSLLRDAFGGQLPATTKPSAPTDKTTETKND